MARLTCMLLLLCLPLSSLFSNCIKGNCYTGYGTYQYGNGSQYIGDFWEGKPHGKGILYMANGNKYLGHWNRDLREGEGRYVFADGHEYMGAFVANRFNGYGKMRYANGDSYEGNWANDRPSGYGTYQFHNGNKYRGEFQEGRFHGQGIFWLSDGSRHEGYWLFNKRHGSGTIVYTSGLATQGEWREGERIDSEEDIATSPGSPQVVLPGAQINVTERTVNNLRPTPQAPFQTEVRIWAILIGVGRYDLMPTLKYTDDDAYQVFGFLKSPEGGAIPDNQIRVLIDEDATRVNVLRNMEQVFSQAAENDVIVFYFSGHGLQDCFLPVDYDGINNRIEHWEVKEIMDRSRAKQKLVVADACHSGGLLTARGGDDVRSALELLYTSFENSSGGTALLMSSKPHELSLEDRGLRSGVFSYFFLRGLKGEADANNDKVITITELYEYLLINVKSYTSGAQTPVLSGAYDPKMPIGVRR